MYLECLLWVTSSLSNYITRESAFGCKATVRPPRYRRLDLQSQRQNRRFQLPQRRLEEFEIWTSALTQGLAQKARSIWQMTCIRYRCNRYPSELPGRPPQQEPGLHETPSWLARLESSRERVACYARSKLPNNLAIAISLFFIID